MSLFLDKVQRCCASCCMISMSISASVKFFCLGLCNMHMVQTISAVTHQQPNLENCCTLLPYLSTPRPSSVNRDRPAFTRHTVCSIVCWLAVVHAEQHFSHEARLVSERLEARWRWKWTRAWSPLSCSSCARAMPPRARSAASRQTTRRSCGSAWSWWCGLMWRWSSGAGVLHVLRTSGVPRCRGV